VELNIATALATFVRSRRLGHVRVGEVGIYTRRHPDRVRAADVLFISSERYARRTTGPGYLDVAPELVVEILAPRDTAVDLMEKLREYFDIGVTLVWVVDPATRRVFVYRAPTVAHEVAETQSLLGEDVLPGFAVPVGSLFDI
jgi:Uma2 family endonuclease